MAVLSSNLQVIDCPCTKRNCPRHGYCAECREYHRTAKRPRPPYCERKRNWLQRLFAKPPAALK
jgi:hypothetical protein